jgi:hypothetical protein
MVQISLYLWRVEGEKAVNGIQLQTLNPKPQTLSPKP